MSRRRFEHALLRTVGPPLLAGVLWLLRRTVRMEYVGDEKVWEYARAGRTMVFAFWHGDMLAELFAGADYLRRGVGRIAVLASLSEDGELLARTVRKFGADAVRGSSSRAARSGLLGLERYLSRTGHVGIAVDGPLGPRHAAKPGVALLARETGAPMIPVTFQYSRAWQLRSWDRSVIPKPFSRCVVTFHAPIAVPAGGRDELEQSRRLVEQVLLAAEP